MKMNYHPLAIYQVHRHRYLKQKQHNIRIYSGLHYSSFMIINKKMLSSCDIMHGLIFVFKFSNKHILI